jgi:hypothetical protein
MYWYVSKPKLQMLKSRSLGMALRNLVIKLGYPGIAGAEVSLDFTDEIQRDVQNLERSVRSAAGIKPFDLLPDHESPDKFWFDCQAARLVDSDAFWVAGRKGSSAVLLVGSSANAIGSPPREDGRISPSMDPLGACRAAFEDSERVGPVDSSVALSYVWNEVMGTLPQGTLAVPKVEGLAVFGGTYRLDATDPSFPQRLVLGSPVYVKQV